MDIGKFPHSLLEKLLQKTGVADPRVLLGPGLGEDAAVLDLGETLLVAKSDPITFATDRLGGMRYMSMPTTSPVPEEPHAGS